MNTNNIIIVTNMQCYSLVSKRMKCNLCLSASNMISSDVSVSCGVDFGLEIPNQAAVKKINWYSVDRGHYMSTTRSMQYKYCICMYILQDLGFAGVEIPELHVSIANCHKHAAIFSECNVSHLPPPQQSTTFT